MKIVQLIDTLSIGGAERMAVNMANAFEDHSIVNLLIVTRGTGRLEAFVKKRDVLRILNKRSFTDLITLFKCYRLIANFKADVLHCHTSSIYWGVLIKLFYPRLKLIWHDHNGARGEGNDAFSSRLKWLSFLIDGVVTVNEKLKKWAEENLRVDEKSLCSLNNFPSYETSSLNWNSRNVNILCIGNLRHPKGHFYLLQAFKEVILRKPKVKLILVGSTNSDVEYYEMIVEEIRKLKLENSVKIEGAKIDLANYYNKAYLGVMSSESEGLPMSLLEYGLAGLPVVVTDVGQCGEVVDYGNAGWVVPPGDSEKLAQAILAALNDTLLAQKKSELLKKRVEQRYGSDNFMNGYQQLIKNITL